MPLRKGARKMSLTKGPGRYTSRRTLEVGWSVPTLTLRCRVWGSYDATIILKEAKGLTHGGIGKTDTISGQSRSCWLTVK